MSILSFLQDRRAGFVLRWHARQTVRQESVAEHQYFVVHDALVIRDALLHYGILKKLGLEPPDEARMLLVAHFHDHAELESGDISGSAKRDFPDLAKAVHKVERRVADSLFCALPGPLTERYRDLVRTQMCHEYATLEQQIVRYSDKLEALLFAQTEIRIGNTLMADVVEQVKGELKALSWPWLVELRRETGLP